MHTDLILIIFFVFLDLNHANIYCVVKLVGQREFFFSSNIYIGVLVIE